MKKLMITLLVAALAMISTPAFAFDLGGYQGSVSWKIIGVTHHSTAQGTWAVFGVETIYEYDEVTQTNGQVLWQNNLTGGSQSLYGVIYGLTDIGFDAGSGGAFDLSDTIAQSGGAFNFYLTNSQVSDTTLNGFTTPGNANAALLASAGSTYFMSGALAGGVLDPNNAALTMTQILTQSASGPNYHYTGGSGEGFANITSGDYAWMFNTNSQRAGTDMHFHFTLEDRTNGLCLPPDPNNPNAQDVCSFKVNDPLVTSATIPEPTSMLLLGAGLFSLVGLRKKK